jgi:L-serine dehydratase
MNLHIPSILNDVIGPVMRGPSSSHCAAALRIGRMARDLMDGEIEHLLVEFDANGSLATTHESQGSDMGLLGGLAGWDATDERLAESARWTAAAGIRVETRIVDLGAADVGAEIGGARHPNTYRLTLSNAAEQHTMVAISTGGGMIEIVAIDDIPVSLAGDYYETLLYLDSDEAGILPYLREHVDADDIALRRGARAQFIEIKAQRFLEPDVAAVLRSQFAVRGLKRISPVLPVLSRRNLRVPFITCEEMLQYNAGLNLSLWELALRYESARGNLPEAEVFERMQGIVEIMHASILKGIAGTQYADRILGCQSGGYRACMAEGRLLDGGMLNRIILYVTAMMEVKSSMGIVVAAPTAGACGGLPGACIGAASDMGLPLEEMTRGMLAAGMIGVFIAAHATFAAETGGCQAECGAGSGMAAASLVTLAGGAAGHGAAGQAVAAASMALQNVLGMTCDPVANRVEVPCLGKNVMAASNALACANMALAGYDPVIPLDEVIETMDRVGRSLPRELRCTALGGLSVTKTSLAIEARLNTQGAT